MFEGCYTALITPFMSNDVDMDGLHQLVSFQIENGVQGIVAVGTTGESPTLQWDEHNAVIESIAKQTRNRCICIAGTGSNNTHEAIEATRHAVMAGVEAVLLVDPYYNGPSSMEIRKEYYTPIAQMFPDVQIIPYIIPGRTGTQLLPEDLAILTQSYTNIQAVKEATGSIDNMKKTRALCGAKVDIISGDDEKTYQMLSDADIQASGVISVMANIAPKAVQEMVMSYRQGNYQKANQLNEALMPLFKMVTVITTENTSLGEVVCRSRNPLPCKTMMRILGMPSGHCRQPSGKMTASGLNCIVETLRTVFQHNPEILEPAANFFNINIEERLSNIDFHKQFIYETIE
jgi:4-hydroxy-tetrahydrodipicolinate synthase